MAAKPELHTGSGGRARKFLMLSSNTELQRRCMESCNSTGIHGMLQTVRAQVRGIQRKPRHAVKYRKENFHKDQGLKMLDAPAVRKRKRIRRWRSLVCCDPFRKRIFKLRQMEVRKNIFANDSQIEHKSYIAGISKAKRFTHLFAWGETNLVTAPFTPTWKP